MDETIPTGALSRAPDPAAAMVKKFFAYDHLPEHLAAVSKPFSDLAEHIIGTVPGSAERTMEIRKLLEAKDCAVRAML